MGATVDVRRKPESDGIGRPVLDPFGRGRAEHLRPVRPNRSIVWRPFSGTSAFLGFPEKAKMLSVGSKVDLEWSGDRFRGTQSIFGISRKGENALCGPQS